MKMKTYPRSSVWCKCIMYGVNSCNDDPLRAVTFSWWGDCISLWPR